MSSLFLDLQMLIWLFPIFFIVHDFEEIIMIEKWLSHHDKEIENRFPTKIADKIIKQFLFVSSSTIMAHQFLKDGLLGNIYYFIIVTLTFFLHTFTHII